MKSSSSLNLKKKNKKNSGQCNLLKSDQSEILLELQKKTQCLYNAVSQEHFKYEKKRETETETETLSYNIIFDSEYEKKNLISL